MHNRILALIEPTHEAELRTQVAKLLDQPTPFDRWMIGGRYSEDGETDEFEDQLRKLVESACLHPDVGCNLTIPKGEIIPEIPGIPEPADALRISNGRGGANLFPDGKSVLPLSEVTTEIYERFHAVLAERDGIGMLIHSRISPEVLAPLAELQEKYGGCLAVIVDAHS